MLAESFPNGRDVQATACRVSLLVADVPNAADLREALSDPKANIVPPLTITVETYLDYLRDMWCPPEAWDEKTRYHMGAILSRDILSRLRPLYRAAVSAAAGVTAETDLVVLKEEAQNTDRQRLAILRASEPV